MTNEQAHNFSDKIKEYPNLYYSGCKDVVFFSEPVEPPTVPKVDYLTRRITAAFRASGRAPFGAMGKHGCTGKACTALSTSADYVLPGGVFLTNSLCIHYVACHRSELSPAELAWLESLVDEAEPTLDELNGLWDGR